MKKSEEIRNALEALAAETEAALKKMVRDNPEKTAENYNQIWRAYWDAFGNAAEKRKAALERALRKELNREIAVGDGVTMYLYSDAHACTVIAKTAKTITIQRDKAILNPNFKPEWISGGFAAHCANQEDQSYTYERDPDGEKIRCYWSEHRGCYTTGGDGSIRIGRGRHEYYDFNF